MQSGRLPRERPARLPRRPGRELRRPAPTTLAVLALSASLALAACTTPNPDPATPTASRPDASPRGAHPESVRRPRAEVAGRIAPATADVPDGRLEALFARARTLVERESDTDLSAVRLRLVDDAAILVEVDLETRRLVRGQLGDSPLSERLLARLVQGQSGTYAALYAGRDRTVLVSREVLGAYLGSLPPSRAVRDEALLVLLLHELVHAADDLRHGVHANRALDFRASFAQSATFEGHAQWLTRTICRREGCLGGLDALDAFMFDAPDEPGAAAGSMVDRDLLEYSYVEGERFVAALAARPGGDALIERLLADPPHDPLQILDPSSYPDEAREAANRVLLAAALDVEHPWLSGPAARVPIATSPLKGVNLRRDPARRAAAVDGFTRLVTAMVAVQFHDPEERARDPIEVTLIRTDRAATARLFADALHAHARPAGARAAEGVELSPGARRAALRRSVVPADGDGPDWHTVIATAGPFVVQAGGRAASPVPMEDYVLAVLDALRAADPA